MSDYPVTSPVWPNYSSANTQRANQDGNSLGKDAFLKLLITQLQNQDPMQPMQDKEFIGQMAQFSALEQMTNIASEMKLLRQSLGFASALIGKTVTWEEYDESLQEVIVKSGIVDAVTVKNGVTYVNIGDKEIEMDRLIRISLEEQDPEEEAGS